MSSYEVYSDSTQINAETCSAPVVKDSTPTQDVVNDGKDIQQADLSLLTNDSITTLIDRALNKFNLTVTDDNKAKVLSKLTAKLNEWIDSDEFDLDIDPVLQTEQDIEKTLSRKGLPNKAAGLKRLIEMLGEE